MYVSVFSRTYTIIHYILWSTDPVRGDFFFNFFGWKKKQKNGNLDISQFTIFALLPLDKKINAT